jgi:acyl-CoA dehydrogenase
MSAELVGTLRERARELWQDYAAPPESAGEELRARAALRALADAELLGYAVAAARGGHATSGLCSDDEPSVRAMCALRDELAYGDGLLDLMFVMQGLGSYPLQMGGRGPFADAVCADVVAGRQIAAYGLTEPGAGSNLDEIATGATRDGAGWRLDGLKTFISNAGIADFYCVLARTSGEPGDRTPGGLTMFFVPASCNGLTTLPFEVIAPHPIGEVRFDGVEVSDDLRLGEVGEGLDLALRTLARFRTTVGAAANGFARRALDESVQHLGARQQFGRPLGANQGLRFDLAEMDARLRAAQLLVDEAALASDRRAPDVARSVARAKLVATETAGWICDRAVQHHGGLGVKRGQIVESLYREVRALRIYEGATEIQRLILGKLVLANGAQPPR